MNYSAWTKPVILGVFIGAAGAIGLGFGMGGWVTTSKATVVANQQARSEVSAALLPICLDLSAKDSERASKIEKIKAAPIYQRNEALLSTGWATMPGTTSSDSRVARECADALMQL